MKSDQAISVDQEVVYLISFNRSKAKFQMEPSTGVIIDDVAGVDEAKQDFKEIVEFLNYCSWSEDSQGCAAGRLSGDGEDSACQSHCRGGRGSLLLPFWF